MFEERKAKKPIYSWGYEAKYQLLPELLNCISEDILRISLNFLKFPFKYHYNRQIRQLQREEFGYTFLHITEKEDKTTDLLHQLKSSFIDK